MVSKYATATTKIFATGNMAVPITGERSMSCSVDESKQVEIEWYHISVGDNR